MHENQSVHPWSNADLFFLRDTLNRGMKPEEVAGFLGRTMGEVTAKAKELRITVFERGKSKKDDGGSSPDAATSAADGDR